MAGSRAELQLLTAKTLMAVQNERLEVNIKKMTDQAITDLFKLGALCDSSSASEKSLHNVSVDINSSVSHILF